VIKETQVMKRQTTLAERKYLLSKIPWVKVLPEPVPCDGIIWGKVALRDIYVMGPHDNPRPPRGLTDKHHCKKMASWHFTPTKASINNWSGKAGNFCWSHLFSAGLYHDQTEEKRTIAWYERNAEKLLAAYVPQTDKRRR